VEDSVIKNSIIQKNSKIRNSEVINSMVGNFVELENTNGDLSIGDYTVLKLN
jgi:glucose-1-phosphate thymidylyltransferase